MNRSFIEIPSFRTEWKNMGLTDNDLLRLQQTLLADPKIGKVMSGTGGARKMRFAFENRGKSGSVPIIYVDFEVYEKIYLLTAYAKSEKENLTKEERETLHTIIDIFSIELKG